MKITFVILGIVAIILYFAFKKKKAKPIPAIPAMPTGPIAASFQKKIDVPSVPEEHIVVINWKVFKKRYLPGLFPEPAAGDPNKTVNPGISSGWLFATWGAIFLILAVMIAGFYYGQTIKTTIETHFQDLTNNINTTLGISNKDFAAFKTDIESKLINAEQVNTQKIDKRLDEISKAQTNAELVLTERMKAYTTKVQFERVTENINPRLEANQSNIAKLQADLIATKASIKPYNDTDIKNQISSMRTEFEGRIRDLTIQAQATPIPTPMVSSIYITQESYMSGENDSVQIFGNQWVGQTYIPQRTIIIDKIRIRLQKVDLLAYGAITVGITQTDANGYPASGYLTSGLIQTASMTNTPNTYEADVDDILLNGSTTYLILIKAQGAPEAKISVMLANPGSAPGFMVANPGGVWQQYVNKDLMFELIRR